MKRFILKNLTLVAVIASLTACGGGGKGKSAYTKLVDQGESQFATGSFADARTSFNAAKLKNPNSATAYIGAAWCSMSLNDIAAALADFQSGLSKTNVNADLYAGYAFALNANGDFALSNQRIDEALNADTDWELSYDGSLNVNDLRLAKAENHFLLGQYTESLAQVKLLNTSFNADVNTVSGRAALSVEIERLRNALGKNIARIPA